MRILYVEDDARDADLTTRTLRKRAPHLELESVSSIEHAFARLNRLPAKPLDLVLADLRLPDGDGLTLLKHIRENNLPLAMVVITGSGDEESAVAALKARADDYVVKSNNYLDRLPLILESALNHYRAEAARRSPLKVLFAAGDKSNVENTRRHLALHAPHLRLSLVSHSSDLLTTLRTDPRYDVVLMDMDLPGASVLDTLRELRLSVKEDVPVVLLCRAEDEELARLGLKLRASDYMLKTPGYLYEVPLLIEAAHSHAELRRREAALETSEARNRALLNAIPDMMFLLTRDGTYLDFHASEIIPSFLPPDRFLGRNVSEVMPPELAAEFHKAFEQASDRPALLEYQLPMPGGDRFYEASIVTCEGDNVLATVRDITERRKADEALRQSESLSRLAQQAARLGTWDWDVQTGSAVWSEMNWRLLGLEPKNEPVTVERFVGFIHPDDREAALHNVTQVLARGEDYYDEFRVIPRNGEVLWLASKGRVTRAADGHAVRMLGVNIDITERKLAEESLKKALAEVQQLKDRLHEENIYLQEEIRVVSEFGKIIGRSEALRKVLRQTEQVAPLDTTVLILGETGTGKELLAHAIHDHSRRKEHPLVKVNSAALPASLIESELFGYAKGAFTGADTRRLGRFTLANGGTIFLDEIGELPLELQAKLLRVLEEGEFELVGSSHTEKVDVRVIAATNRNLSEAVANGTFRSDLYYRLSIFPIVMPPLRERPEDIPMLATHFVKQLSAKLGKQIESIPPRASQALRAYEWPGNVRELRNVIERAVIITQGSKLQLHDTFYPATARDESRAVDWSENPEVEGETLEQSEYRLILQTLKKVHWRIEGPGGAAELLDVHASTLRSRMRKLGIGRPKVNSL